MEWLCIGLPMCAFWAIPIGLWLLAIITSPIIDLFFPEKTREIMEQKRNNSAWYNQGILNYLESTRPSYQHYFYDERIKKHREIIKQAKSQLGYNPVKDWLINGFYDFILSKLYNTP